MTSISWRRTRITARAGWRQIRAALTIWSHPGNNPFLSRALRVEGRRGKPLVSIAATVLALATLLMLAWPLTGPDLWQRVPLLGQSPWPERVPSWLGGNFVGLLAILASAAGGYGVMFAARARLGVLLKREMLGNTLQTLQMLPLSEERWLWMMSAHPLAIALLIGLCGLPVWALALCCGQLSLRDLLGLFVLFLMLGHAMPVWQPLAWRQGTSRQGFNLRAYRNAAQTARDDTDLMALSHTARLERDRRAARALLEIPASTPTEPDSEETEGTPQAKPDAKKPTGWWAAGRSGGGLPAQWWRGMTWWFAVQIGFGSLRPLIGGPFASVWQSLWAALPRDIAALAPAFPLTWPLMLARLLFVPLPFFAFQLPPFLLVVPLWLAWSHGRALFLAASVSSTEAFWTPSRVHRRLWCGNAGWLLSGALIAGYGWAGLVTDAGLAPLLNAPRTPDAALAAAWTLVLVAAALLAMGRPLQAPFRRATMEWEAAHDASALEGVNEADGAGLAPSSNPPISRLEEGASPAFSVGFSDEVQVTLLASTPPASQTIAARQSARNALGLIARAIGFFALSCLLGAQMPGAMWLQRLAPTLLTVFAALLALWGVAAWRETLSLGKRRWLDRARWLWLWWPPVEWAATLLVTHWTRGSWSLSDAPYLVISPLVSLGALFRDPLPVASLDAWWIGPLAHCLIGLTTFGLARARLARAQPQAAASPVSIPGAPLLNAIWAVVRWPFDTLRRAFELLNRQVQRANRGIVRAFDPWQNPVLTWELRRRLERQGWLWQFLILGTTVWGGFLWLAQPWSLPTTLTGRQDWSATVVALHLLLLGVICVFSPLQLGGAFDREKANGQLVFLFLTPQTDRDILLGKLVPTLLYAALLGLTFVPGLLWGAVAAVLNYPASLLTLMLGAVIGVLVLLAIAILFAVVASLAIYFGVRAAKAGEGASKTLLVLLIFEAACWMSMLAAATISAHALGYALGADAAFVTFASATGATLLHLIVACLAWREAQRALKKERYGDVQAAGRGIA